MNLLLVIVAVLVILWLLGFVVPGFSFDLVKRVWREQSVALVRCLSVTEVSMLRQLPRRNANRPESR